jgi:hypothetical protein
MTNSAAVLAQVTAINGVVTKLRGLNLAKIATDLDGVLRHPSLSGAIDALAEGTSDASTITGLFPPLAAVSAELGIASVLLALLGEAATAAGPLQSDLLGRLGSVGIHPPALVAVNHGPVKPVFGKESGPERIFGFTPDP